MFTKFTVCPLIFFIPLSRGATSVTTSQRRKNSKIDQKISATAAPCVADKKQGNLLNIRECGAVADRNPLQDGENKKEGSVAEQFHADSDGNDVIEFTL